MAASDAACVFGEGGVTTQVEAIFATPVQTIEFEEPLCGGLSVGQAGDGVDGFLAARAGDFPSSVNAADLGGTGPIEIACEFAGGRQLALLDTPVPLFSGPGDFEIARRAVPECVVRLRLTAERGDQLWGEKRRRRRRRCPPSGGVGWLLS